MTDSTINMGRIPLPIIQAKEATEVSCPSGDVSPPEQEKPESGGRSVIKEKLEDGSILCSFSQPTRPPGADSQTLEGALKELTRIIPDETTQKAILRAMIDGLDAARTQKIQ